MRLKYVNAILIIVLLFFTYINSSSKNRWVEGMANIPDKLGFIVLRHVNSEDTNKLWIK